MNLAESVNDDEIRTPQPKKLNFFDHEIRLDQLSMSDKESFSTIDQEIDHYKKDHSVLVMSALEYWHSNRFIYPKLN